MMMHCLFEQSGTFKNEFKKLGFEAEDYDIQNDFGQTDHIVDLFAEIRGGYENKPSIFDNIGQDDLIMAFFPCTRFEELITISFKGKAPQQKKWDATTKLEYCMQLHKELHENYITISKLVCICLHKNLKLIIENPAGQSGTGKEHYLQRYWCVEPKMIDKDRRDRGDYYKKPTQFWFINCEPKNNFIWEAQVMHEGWVGIQHASKNATKMGVSTSVVRSMIAPEYANRFIREFILDENGKL